MSSWGEEQRRVDALEARMASDELFYGMLATRAAAADPFTTPPSRKSAAGRLSLDSADASDAFTTPPTRRALALGGSAEAEDAELSPQRMGGNAEVLVEAGRPPDVVLHVGGCAFALHLRALRHRGRGLYKKLLLLMRDRDVPGALIDTDPVSQQQPFSLRLISGGDDEDEIEEEEDGEDAAAAGLAAAAGGDCPLSSLETATIKDADGVGPMWPYTRCARHWDANRQRHEQQAQLGQAPGGWASPSAVETEAAAADEPDEDQLEWPHPSKRRRTSSSEFLQVAVTAAVGVRRRGVAHAELLRADPAAVATCVEYVYSKKVRFVHERHAEQVARLCEWLGLDGSVYYRALRLAVAQATPVSWMPLVCKCAKVMDAARRRVLIRSLVDDVLPTFRADQLVEFFRHANMMPSITAIQDRATLIDVMVGIIHHARLFDLWWSMFHAFDFWLWVRGPLRATADASPMPAKQSLLTLHRHYAPWEPVFIIPKYDFFHQHKALPTIAKLVEFGGFALQVRFELGGSAPILWRVVKMSSPSYENGAPVELGAQSRELKGDPSFCIRGQLKIKYQRPSHLEGVVKDEVAIEYQHCAREYGAWRPLVSAMSATAEVVRATDEWWAGEDAAYGRGYGPRKTIAKIRGKAFVWGDTLCNLYHYLLVSTLFYCPPRDTPRDMADLLIMEEMQRLPLDTLVLVLLSDRLRLPGGETTLVRILTRMIFRPAAGKTAGRQSWRGYNGSASDVVAIFRCVRWCFVHLSQILATLAKSPRRLRLYELIQDGLKNTHMRFRRRTPWGWNCEVDAYAANMTNLADFEIEAGDRNLSPSQFDDSDDNSSGRGGGGGGSSSPPPSFPPLLPGVN